MDYEKLWNELMARYQLMERIGNNLQQTVASVLLQEMENMENLQRPVGKTQPDPRPEPSKPSREI